MVIGRQEIREVLSAWVDGRTGAQDVWVWAQRAKAAGEPQDVLVRDLIDILETLPYDLVLEEDAAVMIDALQNPPEEADLSVNLVWNHMDGVDQDGRRYRLSRHEFYGAFCDVPE